MESDTGGRSELDGSVDAILDRHAPVWERPAAVWRDGALLGNGQVGAVVWGDGAAVNLSIDHTGFWDRSGWSPSDDGNFTWSRFVASMAGEADWPGPFPLRTPRFDHDMPTRMPPSRVNIVLPADRRVAAMRLDLARAVLEIDTTGGPRLALQVRVLCGERTGRPGVVLVEADGADASMVDVEVRFFSEAVDTDGDGGAVGGLVERGIADPERSQVDGVSVVEQAWGDGTTAAMAWSVARHQNGSVIAVAVHHRRPGGDAEVISVAGEAAAAVVDLGDADYRHEALGRHVDAWRAWWQASWLSVPDGRIEALHCMETYKLRCATRPDGDPIALQGPWSPPGQMPPWRGDYHHNVNVQMSYWPLFAGNRTSSCKPLLEFVRRARPLFAAECRRFFGVDGEIVVHATDIDGHAMYDWVVPHYAFSSGPWLAQILWLWWRHADPGSADAAEIENVLRSFAAALAVPLLAQLEEGADGFLHLPLTYSPEYEPTWGPDATCDLALLRWLLELLVALGAGADNDVAGWHETLARLSPPPVASLASSPVAAAGRAISGRAPGGFMVRGDRPYDRSHRHLSHLLPIYPLCQVTVDDGSQAQALVEESLLNLTYQGQGEWVGFTVAWAAALFCHARQADRAVALLQDYVSRWLCPSSLMLQASPGSASGSVWDALMPVLDNYLTLEAGFGAASAVQDLLIQSHNGVVRVFPCVPTSWPRAAFSGLRAQGGFVISAALEAGSTTHLSVTSRTGGRLTVRYPIRGHIEEVTIDVAPSATHVIQAGPEPRPVRLREHEHHLFGLKS